MPLLQVRSFPQDLYERLGHRAKVDRRSISQEVIVLLAEALAPNRASEAARQAALAQTRASAERLGGRDLPDPAELIRQDRDR
ncbi:MAG: hypothetical protein LBG60_11635 [Bifidobacteriaceae bacterium]|jgi:plasmid stability protein|nr:hypothetical protein [Bifidobacteriaceae bacterium]